MPRITIPPMIFSLVVQSLGGAVSADVPRVHDLVRRLHILVKDGNDGRRWSGVLDSRRWGIEGSAVLGFDANNKNLFPTQPRIS
jgi:hypothetical protein